MLMTPPIVVSEHGDVMFFKSVEDAENALEAIDVENHEYEAFDAEGRVLDLGVRTAQKPTLLGLLPAEVKTVAIASRNEQPVGAEALRATLVDFLARLGVPTELLKSESLESLLKQGLERTGFAR